MLTLKQIELFSLFIQDPYREYSFKEFRLFSKVKSTNFVQYSIKQFKQDDLVIEKKIGTSKLYSLNFNNEMIYTYLSFLNKDRLNENVLKILDDLKTQLEKYEFFYSVVIFGSYANKTNSKKSDLDIAIIIPEKSSENRIIAVINAIKRRSLLGVDAHIITQDNLLDMLKADYENLGKEIARKNLPIINPSIFFKIIKRGVDNGFRG